MAAKLLLCLSADQATVAVWRGHRLSACHRFDNNESGWTAFGDFLRSARGLPVHIVVDTVDEDFRFETLPHVRGRDRTEMVGRKLKQIYRNTPYCSYALPERETGKRRDDRYLFAALTNPELLDPWLRAIDSRGMPVSGIYPLPMVTVTLIEHLRLKHPNLLIVTKNSAGLRQTFFKELKFRISRLTPLRGTPEAADQYYADEVNNTRIYLDALTVTHVDDVVQVVLLDQNDSLAGLSAAIAQGRPNLQCHHLDRGEVQALLGITAPGLEVSADALHLHLLGKNKPALNLAPPAVMRSYQRYAARRWVYAASAATLAGALLWSGAGAYEVMRLEDEMLRLREQTATFQAQYQQVTAQFPDAPTSADNLRDSVELALQVGAILRSPETMFSVVSHALDASPGIELTRLEWHYGERSGIAGEAAPSGTGNPAAASGGPAQIGIVHGEVKPFDGDYRTALGAINAFAVRLAEASTVAEVRALRLPLDVRSDSGLSGSTGSNARQTSAQFQIAVIFRPGA